MQESDYTAFCGLEKNATESRHYKYVYKQIRIDPYRIFKIYNITDGAQQHAIKKLLRAGRSVKSLEQDIKETIETLNRWLEMIAEDSEVNTSHSNEV